MCLMTDDAAAARAGLDTTRGAQPDPVDEVAGVARKP